MAEYIELPSNNLYSNGYLTTLDDGAVVLERKPLRIAPQEQDRWHIVEFEDMLDELAQRYYGQIVDDAAKLWWMIADANGLANPLDLSNNIGSLLLIPEYFRIQRLTTIDQTADDSELPNYFEVVGNPPTPINPPDTPTEDGSGVVDTPSENAPQWLFLKQPNGGFTLVTADNSGLPEFTPANPNDFASSVIFEAKP